MSEVENAAPAPTENSPEESAEEVIGTLGEESEGATEVSEESDDINAEEATDEELAEVAGSEDTTEEEKIEAKQELVKRLKLKVNGREYEEEIDFNDEDSLRDILQKGAAADEKFQKASNLEKQMKNFAELMQKDPLKALEAAGHDMEKLSQKYMEDRIAQMQKSPEQQRLEELEKQIEAERERNENLEREKQEAEQSRAQEEYSRQLDDEITGALESSSLPKSPYVVKRIAENLMLAMDEGYEDVTVDQILPIVEKQIQGEIRQMFEAMPEDVIERTLGNNVSTKLRKRRISRQKKLPTKAAEVKATGTSEIKKAQANAEKPAKTNAKDFFKNF